jgi:hypothetical protein
MIHKNQTNDVIQTGCKSAYIATTSSHNQTSEDHQSQRGEVSRMWLPPFNPNPNQTKTKLKTPSLLENSNGVATPTPSLSCAAQLKIQTQQLRNPPPHRHFNRDEKEGGKTERGNPNGESMWRDIEAKPGGKSKPSSMQITTMQHKEGHAPR